MADMAENIAACPAVLSIAGSDSGGGAGIQADIKTITVCGCYAASVITAVTAQNTLGVAAIEPVSAANLEKQLTAVFEDIHFAAVKIGMLHNVETIQIVAQALLQYRPEYVVLDPVMVATCGDKLLQDSAIDALRQELLPLADIITPNLAEAEILLGRKISSPEPLAADTEEIATKYQSSVLFKGGHFASAELTDMLYNWRDKKTSAFTTKRINTANTHGTGCTLSAAIASFLALRLPLEEAVRSAIAYLHGALLAGSYLKIGAGNGPVDHFYRYRQKSDRWKPGECD